MSEIRGFMKYAYEKLSPEQFERLIVFLCQKLLGMGGQGFAKGRDGEIQNGRLRLHAPQRLPPVQNKLRGKAITGGV